MDRRRAIGARLFVPSARAQEALLVAALLLCGCRSRLFVVHPAADAAAPRDMETADLRSPAIDMDDMALPIDLALPARDLSAPSKCPLPPSPTVTELATLRIRPSAVAVDGTNVYWLDSSGDNQSGEVMKLALPHGAPVPLAVRSSTPSFLTLDADNVYFTEDVDVLKVPIHGGAAVPLASAQSTPIGIAIYGPDVYWVNKSGAGGGSIMKAPVGGGHGATEIAGGLTSPWGLAVDGDGIYFDQESFPSTVARVGLGGGMISIFEPGYAAVSPLGVAVANGTVYYLEYLGATGFVKSVSTGGGMVKVIADKQDHPWSIALDDQYVYWGDLDAGIWKAALDGTCVAQLTSASPVVSIAVDATSVYYVGGEDLGSVWRLTPK